MDNAVALASPRPLPVTTIGFTERVKLMPARAKVSFAVGIVALAGVIAALTMNLGSSDFKPLYASLSDKDGGAVIAQLSTMNVPYKVGPGGTIMVPALQVPDLRLKLATAGLPKGAVSGFELMDNARFGQTQFQERLTFQRGLEGELTRSITSLASVQAARVHLALPNQNGFFREQQKPSASVVVTLHPGRSLDRAQVAGIVHLVSSSVPELDAKNVSVLDQSGSLLAGGNETTRAAGLDAQQLQYVNQVEGGYTKRIFELIEPIVGHDNLRATVTADVDFSQSEATTEEYKPNQGADASVSIRGQQTSEQGGGTGAAGGLPSGVPGAASNQPPVAATAPITGASQPLNGSPLSGAGAVGAGGRRETVVNYELDKSVRVTRNASGNVKRLNAAVVLNNRSVTDAKGKTTQVPLAADELEKLTALVKESIGFNAERGDSVKVINAPFKVESIVKTDTPFWQQPDLLDWARTLALPGVLGLVAVLVLFGLIRPAMKTIVVPKPPLGLNGAGGADGMGGMNGAGGVNGMNGIGGGNGMDGANGAGGSAGNNLNTIANDRNELPALPSPQSSAQLDEVRRMARDNPAAVAGILRGWVENGVEAVPAR